MRTKVEKLYLIRLFSGAVVHADVGREGSRCRNSSRVGADRGTCGRGAASLTVKLSVPPRVGAASILRLDSARSNQRSMLDEAERNHKAAMSEKADAGEESPLIIIAGKASFLDT